MNINNINVNKYPVSQVFDPDSKVIFEIPKYQRKYTWGTREWEALFDYLIENDDGYFLGSIMVHWDNGSGLNVVYGVDVCRKMSK